MIRPGKDKTEKAVNVISSICLTISKPVVPLFLYLSFSFLQGVINSIDEALSI